MLLPLLLSASLYQAAEKTLPLSCYYEKKIAVCYDSAGNLVSAVSSIPIDNFADSLVTDIALNALGSGADLLSTDYALQHGCKEGNPLAPRPEGRTALKMGAAAVRGSAAFWLRRHGHKRFADVFRYLGLGVDLLVTANNVKCGIK